MRLTSIKDGLSNTIYAGEKAMDPIDVQDGSGYWDEPIVLGGTGGSARCGQALIPDGPGIDVTGPAINYPDGLRCGGGNWGAPTQAGVQFVFCDGSVHSLPYSTPPAAVQLLIRPSDGGVVDQSSF
jgi:hypothetical protein